MQSLSAGDRYWATKQRIPSLKEVLQATKQSNLSIMFDLRPENHSDYQSFVNATLEVILQSGIPLQQVSWPHPHRCQALLSLNIPATPYPYLICDPCWGTLASHGVF